MERFPSITKRFTRGYKCYDEFKSVSDAFINAARLREHHNNTRRRAIEQLSPPVRLWYNITLILFGYEHVQLLTQKDYDDAVKTLRIETNKLEVAMDAEDKGHWYWYLVTIPGIVSMALLTLGIALVVLNIVRK